MIGERTQLHVGSAKRGRVWSMQLPEGDAGTLITIDAMKELAIDAARHPLIRRRARMVHDAASTTEARLGVLYRWLLERVWFKADPPGQELLRHPSQLEEEILHGQKTFADCDDLSMYAASILLAMGIPAGFVTMTPFEGRPFAHVFAIAVVDGREIALDSQERLGLGREAYAERRRSFLIDEG